MTAPRLRFSLALAPLAFALTALTALAALAALAAALALALAAAPAQAAPTTIATYGQGAGKVSLPTGTAVDPNPASSSYRDLYVADYNNFRVERFGPEGSFQLAWGFGVADGKSHAPQTCGPAGEAVRCFAGSNTASASGALAPSSLALDPSTGDLYVADSNNLRVSEYKPDGEFLRAFGGGVASGGAAGTGDLTAGSKTVEGVTLTGKRFLKGQIISGPGIPAGTEITRVYSNGRLELSKPATETATGVTLTAAEDPGNVPTNEQQTIALDPAATSGNFKLRFAPPIGSAQSTANIPYNATPGEVQSALAALSSIGAGNILVGSSNPGGGAAAGGPYEVEFTGERYADTNVAQLEIKPGSPNLDHSAASKVETTQQGALAPEVCTTACVEGELASQPGVFAESDYATQGPSPGAIAFDPSGDLRVLSGGRLQRFAPDGSFLSEVPVPAGSQVRGLAIDPISEDFYLLGPPGYNEAQLIIFPGTADFNQNGEYTLSFEGETTPPLTAHDRFQPGDLEQVQTALEALPAIGAGNVSLTPAGSSFEMRVTFVHDLGGRNVPQLSATTLSATAPVTVTTRTQGNPGSVLRLDSETGEEPVGSPPLDAEEGDLPQALLTDSAGNLYVGDAGDHYHFLRYDSAGLLGSAFGARQVIGAPQGNALALDESSGTLYAASSSSTESGSAVQAFPLPEPGPLPEGLEAKEVLPTAATLAATLNPEGSKTTYRFQYLTQAEYEAHGFAQCGEAANPSCAQTPPRTLPEGSPPPEAGYEAEAIGAPVEALLPATEYRFRLLAENEAGEVEPETTFKTRPAVGIEAQWASEVSAREATLNASLHPLGAPAAWWVEYDTAPYAGQSPHGTRLPLPPGACPRSPRAPRRSG